MTIKMVGRNIKLTQGLKHAIIHEVEQLDRKHFNGNPCYRTKVILKVVNGQHFAKVLVYKNKRVFIKTYRTEDMYKSIRGAFDIMDRELRKHKEKIRHKKWRKTEDVLFEQEDDLFLESDDDKTSSSEPLPNGHSCSGRTMVSLKLMEDMFNDMEEKGLNVMITDPKADMRR